MTNPGRYVLRRKKRCVRTQTHGRQNSDAYHFAKDGLGLGHATLARPINHVFLIELVSERPTLHCEASVNLGLDLSKVAFVIVRKRARVVDGLDGFVRVLTNAYT